MINKGAFKHATILDTKKIDEILESEKKALSYMQHEDFEEALRILRFSFIDHLNEISFEGMNVEDLPLEFLEQSDFHFAGISLENMKIQLEDTVRHKIFILQACGKMANVLEASGEKEKAYLLVRRAFAHDLSKLNRDEFFGLARFSNDMEAMTNINVTLPSAEKLKIISLHWSRNSHHPEFHSCVNEMNDMDIIEMCCDWHARSLQFGTNTIQWLKEKFQKRFGFSDTVYQTVFQYCTMLELSYS